MKASFSQTVRFYGAFAKSLCDLLTRTQPSGIVKLHSD